MAHLPRIRRLAAESFEGAPGWFLLFLNSFNDFVTDVTAGLAQRLELEERVVRTGAAVTADALPFPIVITPRFKTKPRALWVVGAENVTGATFATGVFPTWSVMANGQVKIRFLTGLAINSEYRLTFALE